MREARKTARIVAVFGGYRVRPSDPIYAIAREVGRLVVESGWTLMNGGYSGTMQASAQGAREAGGRVIGVPVEIFSAQVNPFVDETWLTHDLWERIRLMIERSDAFIALPGSTGTLAEVSMAWEFICKNLMPRKPLVFLGEFWQPLYRMLVAGPEAEAACGGLVRIELTPKEAIDFLRRYWKE